MAFVDYKGLGGMAQAVAEGSRAGALQRFRPAIDVVLVCGLGAALALACLALIAPLPVPASPAPPTATSAAPQPPGPVGDPFRLSAAPTLEAAETAPEVAETTLDLTLHGVWTDGVATAAIRTPDGRQRSYTLGDEVWQGVTLDAVYADQVILLRAGAREALRLINRTPIEGRARASTAAPASAASAPASDPAGFLERVVRVTPRIDAGGLKLVLQPGAEGSAFAALGLEPGDTLLAIDGQPLGRDLNAAVSRLERVGAAKSATITIDRGGRRLDVPIDVSRLQGLNEDD